MRYRFAVLALLIMAQADDLWAESFRPQGTIEVGGTFSLSRESIEVEDDDSTRTTLTLTPSVGYFIKPDVAIVGSLLISNSELDDGDAETSSTLFGFMAGAAYYEPFGPAFLVPQAMIGYSSLEQDDFYRESGIMLELRGNLKLPLGDRAAAQLGLALRYSPRDFEFFDIDADGSVFTLLLDGGFFVYF